MRLRKSKNKIKYKCIYTEGGEKYTIGLKLTRKWRKRENEKLRSIDKGLPLRVHVWSGSKGQHARQDHKLYFLVFAEFSLKNMFRMNFMGYFSKKKSYPLTI